MRRLTSLLAGAIFGLGLVLSGMTDTTKVQGWLDVAGAWDPTLAFVLSGAILSMVVAWRLVARRDAPVFGGTFPAAARQSVDRPLILGAALFGTGWALVGLCPGPALASLSFGGWQGAAFFVAMAAGMGANRLLAGPNDMQLAAGLSGPGQKK